MKTSVFTVKKWSMFMCLTDPEREVLVVSYRRQGG